MATAPTETLGRAAPAPPAPGPPGPSGVERRAAGRRRLLDRLFAPIDISSLVFFRIAFGLIMLLEVWRYLALDLVGVVYVVPRFHFTFDGFEWVRPWPGSGMYVHFYGLCILVLCIAFGFCYRLATTLFFFGFTYVFLLERAVYLNHYYLACVISLLLIFIPAHRAFSVDAWLRPKIRSSRVPAWTLGLLLAQISIVYFYAGLAKLDPDWLTGAPLRIELGARTGTPIIGPLFTREAVVQLFTYGALLLDLLVAPLLIWRRTRLFALVAALGFHFLNGILFSIGIFPWLMTAATLLFLPPDWPRRLIRRLRALGGRPLSPTAELRGERSAPPGARMGTARRVTVGLLGAYLLVHLLVPFRHHLYPGNVNWGEEGQYFAWHMLLRNKHGTAEFFATDPATNRTWRVDHRAYLRDWQVSSMVIRPALVLQFSHHLADELRRQGYRDVEIRARVMASLNGRPPELLIDPTVDLARQPRASLAPAPWIMPLSRPLPMR